MTNANTATERLRELLDERGVEHYDHENDEPLRDEAKPDLATSWRMGDASVCAVPDKNGTFDLWIDHATPEQAIAATLGNDGLERSNDGVERSNDGVAETCVPDDYTAKLMAELVQVMEERDTLSSKFEVSQGMRHDEHERYTKENASLRERITTQKQTIQVYRDESREWREVAEHAQAENAKLRELCKLAFTCIEQGEDEYGTDWSCAGCELCDKCDGLIQARATAQELGVEVDA